VRVLHITAGNIYGGVERVITTIAAERASCDRMEPFFALSYRGRTGDELEKSGAAVDYLGEAHASEPWTVWGARSRLTQVLRERAIDLVVTHAAWPHAMFARTAKRNGARVVLWLHAPFRGHGWLERWAARTSPDAAVCNSEYTCAHSQVSFRDVPMEVIYSPVTSAAFLGHEDTRAADRMELGAHPDECVIVQVARIEALKGHSLLISSLALLSSQRRWVCWIVGAPASARGERLLDELKATTRQLGIAARVRFLGERSDVTRILAAADVFCQPNSEPDAFGIAVIEALAQRLPVVATALGGPVEILSPSYGILVRPADPPALAAALSQLMADAAAQEIFRQAGPGRALSLCEPHRQINRLSDFFERAMQSKSHVATTTP
jgi:glycosyltransferase involved in cell wall biosynthesis